MTRGLPKWYEHEQCAATRIKKSTSNSGHHSSNKVCNSYSIFCENYRTCHEKLKPSQGIRSIASATQSDPSIAAANNDPRQHLSFRPTPANVLATRTLPATRMKGCPRFSTCHTKPGSDSPKLTNSVHPPRKTYIAPQTVCQSRELLSCKGHEQVRDHVRLTGP